MNIALHRRVMLSILQKLYKHNTLSTQLGFKGGTSLYFLHELSRFSVDLDFNLLHTTNLDINSIESILQSELQLNDVQEKANGWLWNGIYTPGEWNLKVEVSKRQFDDEYEKKDLLGLPLQAMKLEYQLSHKLCAITDRNILANRDIFDAHFLLQKHVSIIPEIIVQRTQLTVPEYLQKLCVFIPEHVSKRGLLDNLGQLVDDAQKHWIKATLMDELLFLLQVRISEYSL